MKFLKILINLKKLFHSLKFYTCWSKRRAKRFVEIGGVRLNLDPTTSDELHSSICIIIGKEVNIDYDTESNRVLEHDGI